MGVINEKLFNRHDLFCSMEKQKIYPFRVKAGAYGVMSKILCFPEVTEIEINEAICRVTVNDYSTELSLKKEFVKQYENDQIFQIRLLENNDQEFIVLASMFESLPEPVILK